MNETKLNPSGCWERIKQLCKKRGVFQKVVCEELGLTDQTIRNKVTRGAFPSIEELVLFAQYFNVSTDFILLGTPNIPMQEKYNALENKLNKISDIISEPISSCNE